MLLLLFFFLAPSTKSQHPPEILLRLSVSQAKHFKYEFKLYLERSWHPVDVAAVRPEIPGMALQLHCRPRDHRLVASPQLVTRASFNLSVWKSCCKPVEPLCCLFPCASSTALLSLTLVGWGKTFGGLIPKVGEAKASF